MSSREFDQDVGGARRAAEKGPVVIADRGRPSHVLLSFKDYRRLAGAGKSVFDIVAQDVHDEIDFDPPLMGARTFQDPDCD